MKKQTVVIVWLAILLLLVVICIGMYFAHSSYMADKDEPIELFTCVSSEIEKYTVSDKNGSYSLEKDESGWYLTDDKEAELDMAVVEKMLASASKITAIKKLGLGDLSSFDNSDEKTVTFDIADGKSVKISFLGTYENLCAFKLSRNRRIYAMYESLKDILAPPVETLRVTTVFPQLAQAETMPEYYRYTDYSGDITEIRIKTSAELSVGKNNRYMMEKPHRLEVSDDAFEQQIAVKIPLIKVKRFLKEHSQNMQEYGLDKESRAELFFTWNDKNETLYLGKEVNGEVFATRNTDKSIFTVSSSSVEFLQFEPFFILDSSVLKASPEKISSVKITVGEDVYKITSENKTDTGGQFFINGKAATRYVFNEIVEKLSVIGFKNETDTPPENTKDTEIMITYDDGGIQNISFAKSGEKTYAVFIDGKAKLEVNISDVDALIEKVKEATVNPMKMD